MTPGRRENGRGRDTHTQSARRLTTPLTRDTSPLQDTRVQPGAPRQRPSSSKEGRPHLLPPPPPRKLELTGAASHVYLRSACASQVGQPPTQPDRKPPLAAAPRVHASPPSAPLTRPPRKNAKRFPCCWYSSAQTEFQSYACVYTPHPSGVEPDRVQDEAERKAPHARPQDPLLLSLERSSSLTIS